MASEMPPGIELKNSSSPDGGDNPSEGSQVSKPMKAPRAIVKTTRALVLTLDRTHAGRRRYRPYVSGQRLQITNWLYRPGLGWDRIVRRAGQSEVDAAGSVPVLVQGDPALVPLETLPGRNHYAFPASELPPWQWRIAGRYPGWSS
jgi:hypothetical protein